MKQRAKKQWNGGVIPELSEIDKLYVDHVKGCSACQHGGSLSLCKEGRKLYSDLRGQYEKQIDHARCAPFLN